MDRDRGDALHGPDAGFSLVELLVVVVILGILAAVAIPAFSGIQDKAQKNALAAMAESGATGASAQVSQGLDPASSLVAESGYVLEWQADVPSSVDDVCVIATHTASGKSALSGPGCTHP